MLAERTHVLQDLNSKFPLTILLPVIDLDYLTLKAHMDDKYSNRYISHMRNLILITFLHDLRAWWET